MKTLLLKLALALLIIPFFTNAQNNALNFDGIDDEVSIGLIDFTSSDKITISAWIKPDNITSLQNVIEIGDGNGHALWLNTNGGFYGSSVFNTSGWITVTSNNFILEQNKWQHIAYTYDGFNQKIYLNGVEVGINPISEEFKNLPSGDTGISENGGYLDGAIDEVRLWNIARSETEIRANMYQELVGNEAGLVAYYNFNATSGTSLIDNSTNSNTGTLTNMTGTEWFPSSAFFGPKNALDFNSITDYCNKNSNVTSNLDNFTMMAWAKPDVLAGWRVISYNGDDSGGYGFGISGNKVAGLFGTTAWNITDEVLPSTGIWYHIAMRRSSGSTQFFLNGKLLSYSVDTAPVTVKSRFTIGNMIAMDQASLYGDSFDGQIDEVRVYAVALSDQQIRENMNNSLVGNETGLVAYYNFDNSSGTILQDFSGNANDLTLTNMDAATDWVTSTAFNTWLNTNSTSWATATNWSNGIPVSTENVGIYNYSGLSPILSDTPTMNNVVVGNSAGLTLSSNVTVNGNLFLYDNLDLNGQIITLGSTATLYEDGGLISGNSGTITTTRNLNNIDENVGGLGAEITTSSNLGSTVITRGHTVQTGNANSSIQRYYDITPEYNEELNATFTFNYDDSELNGLTESNLNLFKSTDDGANWSNVDGTLDPVNNTISLIIFGSFSRWTAAEDLTLSIEDNIIRGFNMYPNPAKDFLNITAREEIKNVKIFNIIGQQLVDKIVNSFDVNLDLRLLPKGTYIVKIYTNTTVKSVKFIND